MDYIIYNGELYHHGIKGMKWGIRRYQNKDGSLTPAGKKRVSEGDRSENKKEDEYLDRPRRSREYLAKFSGKNASEISDGDAGCFQYDVSAVLSQTTPDRISSKNPADVKEVREFINDGWKYEMSITDAYVTSRDGSSRELISERAKKYYDAYIKSDPDMYARSVIEEIEYRELHHSSTNVDELYHHGTKGMKWGIRRYQNKDGSLTPAGVKRYNREVQKLKDREASIKAKEKAKKYQDKLDKKKSELDEREAALKGKSVSKSTSKAATANKQSGPRSIKDMSDAELRAIVNRMQLEQQYRSLAPQQVSKGKKFVDSILNNVIAPAAKEVGKNVAKSLLTKAANDMLGVQTGDNKNKKKDKKDEDD